MTRKALPWWLGAATALFYLCYPSHFFNFDGVACAIAVDLGDWAHLVHGNHLGYGPIALMLARLWGLLGYSGPSLPLLGALDSLLGGAGVVVFAALLLQVGLGPWAALAGGMALASSYAWWFWSLEAQVYMLGALFMLLAAKEVLADKPRPLLAGSFLALAALGHVGHLFFVPACLYALATGPSGDRRRWRGFLLALGLVVASAYALAGALCVRPANFDELRLWLLGSAALGKDRSFNWIGGYSAGNVWLWIKMTIRIYSDGDGFGGTERLLAWILSGTALTTAIGATEQIRTREDKGRLARFAVLWIAGYAVLYMNWQPQTMVYRISDLAPLWFLACLAASRWKYGWTCVAVWAVVAGHFNATLLIIPRIAPAANVHYQKSLSLRALVPENAWLVALTVDQVYYPYFAHRRPLNVRYFAGREEELAKRLDALAAAGEPVFVTSDTLELEGWKPFFEAYGLFEGAPPQNGWKLLRVSRRHKEKGTRAVAGKKG